MWFKRKPKTTVFRVPLDEHVHRYLIDTGLGDVWEHLAEEGRVPPSQEGRDHEQMESDDRLVNAAPAAPLLVVHAAAAAKLVVKEQLSNIPSGIRDSLPEDYPEQLTRSLAEVILRTSMASISQLLDLGMLVHGNIRTIGTKMEKSINE